MLCCYFFVWDSYSVKLTTKINITNGSFHITMGHGCQFQYLNLTNNSNIHLQFHIVLSLIWTLVICQVRVLLLSVYPSKIGMIRGCPCKTRQWATHNKFCFKKMFIHFISQMHSFSKLNDCLWLTATIKEKKITKKLKNSLRRGDNSLFYAKSDCFLRELKSFPSQPLLL